MNPTVIGLAVILILGHIAGHFNRKPEDWPILVSAVKGGLSKIKYWLDNGEPDVVYPVVIVCGGSLVLAVNWVLL